MKLRSLLYSGAVLLTATLAPAAAFAQSQVPAARENPFSFSQRQNVTIQGQAGFGSSQSSLVTIIGNIINIVLSFLGILLLVYLVYAGFLWMTATDDKAPGKAKDMIKNAIIGLIIIVSSFAISRFVLDALPTITR
jgi:heme/copper-type cytochrome/quinol oxidase subunit 2